jgi:hypothetical protein
MALKADEILISKKEASHVAVEWVKQLITLSSGIIAVSAAFLYQVKDLSWYFFIPLVISWGLLLISIIYGLNTISGIVGFHLDNLHDWSEGTCKTNAIICKHAFISGICFFVIFGLIIIIF